MQAPTSLTSFVSVPVGTGNTTYTGPYGVEFNNAWYTGVGTPLLYVVGTGSGTNPTLYSVGFSGRRLAQRHAERDDCRSRNRRSRGSPVTEFYNSTLQKDFLFLGVTNNCVATSTVEPPGV